MPILAPLLAIESTGSACSAAVADHGGIVAAERLELRHGHAERLLPLVDRAMAAAGLTPSRLAAVAAATGPGSFTGIRAGLAAAQGIALALDLPLIGVTSFAAVAAGLPAAMRDRVVLVALDSRREDFYVQLLAAGVPLAPPQAMLPDRLAAYVGGLAGDAPLLIAGNAAETAACGLDESCAVELAPDASPDARGVAAAALQQLHDAAAHEPARPLYLRPPGVTFPQRRTAMPGSAA